MKGFAATLTAARLEKALAFYMTPEARRDNSADPVASMEEHEVSEIRTSERARDAEDRAEAAW